MIPEYLFKQAEREANAAMMKELYTEGSMEPAVAGMDPENIDPEVAAAINTILSKLQKSEEPEERHTVEKASSLRDCIFKVAEDASIEDVNRRDLEKLAVLSTNPIIRKAFRQLKGINDKFLDKRSKLKDEMSRLLHRNEPKHTRFDGDAKYNYRRNIVDEELAAYNTNPGWSDIIQTEGAKGIVSDSADTFTPAKGQMDSLNMLKKRGVKVPYRGGNWIPETPTQQDIDDYMEARHMLYKYLHPGEEAGTYRDPNSLTGKLKNWREGWNLVDSEIRDSMNYDKAIPFTMLR